MKRLGLFILIICILTLAGCNKTEPGNIDAGVSTKIPSTVEETKDTPVSSVPEDSNSIEDGETDALGINFKSEKDIRDYLIGQWISDKETLSDYLFTQSDINCNMSIDQDLNVNLFFYNRYTNEPIGDYQGEISLDSFDENSNELPDLISIDLGDSDWPGGDYFFLHRTIYDGKSVMSLFFAGNGNCIFDLLGDLDNFEYAPEEILFEKASGEKSNLEVLKEAEFYAVYWGSGPEEKSLWLDEVQWTPSEEYDPDAFYPTRMTLYQDKLPGSVLYVIAGESIDNILINPMYPGEAYFVKTDKSGNIIEFEDAAYRDYIDTINKP